MHFVRGEDGLAAVLVTHLDGFEARAVVVHEAEQPVVPVKPELAPAKPLREEVAAVFRGQRLRLVLPDLAGVEHLAVEVLAFDGVAVH